MTADPNLTPDEAVELLATALALGEPVQATSGVPVYALAIIDPSGGGAHLAGLFPTEASARSAARWLVLREMVMGCWGPWNEGHDPDYEPTDEVIAHHVEALGGPDGLVEYHNKDSAWIVETRTWQVLDAHPSGTTFDDLVTYARHHGEQGLS